MPTETFDPAADRTTPEAPAEQAPRTATQEPEDSATVVTQMGEDPGDLSQPAPDRT